MVATRAGSRGYNLPFAKGWVTTPEQNRQTNHEEGVCTQVRSDGEVAVERGRAQLVLHPSKVRGLPTYQREHLLSQGVPPFGKRPLVCNITSDQMELCSRIRIQAHTVVMAPQSRIRDIVRWRSIGLGFRSIGHGDGVIVCNR